MITCNLYNFLLTASIGQAKVCNVVIFNLFSVESVCENICMDLHQLDDPVNMI